MILNKKGGKMGETQILKATATVRKMKTGSGKPSARVLVQSKDLLAHSGKTVVVRVALSTNGKAPSKPKAKKKATKK